MTIVPGWVILVRRRRVSARRAQATRFASLRCRIGMLQRPLWQAAAHNGDHEILDPAHRPCAYRSSEWPEWQAHSAATRQGILHLRYKEGHPIASVHGATDCLRDRRAHLRAVRQ